MDKKIINYMIKQATNNYPELSDLLFIPYEPFEILLYGRVHRLNIIDKLVRFSPFQVETIAMALIENRRRLLKDLVTTGSCDLSYQVDNIRLRVNIFSQRTGYAIVMRKLPEKVPTIEEMDLPMIFKEISREISGIVLFAGPTGSGKSTSIAAILEEINRTRPAHIITLEDPIEFKFTSKKASFNQRELGVDFNEFAMALRAALREAPHVIMVGEIRDNETAASAMGKDITKRHLQIFVIGSAIAGVSGAMLVTYNGQFTPGSYIPLRYTFLIWVMVIVGGSGNNLGSVVGGFIIWFLWIEAEPVGFWLADLSTSFLDKENYIRQHLLNNAQYIRLIFMGAVLLVVMRFSPDGILPETNKKL